VTSPIGFPPEALLILEERLRQDEAEGVPMPEGVGRDELALPILIAAELVRRGHGRRGDSHPHPVSKMNPQR
jgi:hypothetical protein